MIDPEHPRVSIKKQCDLLSINRSSYYYQKRPIREEDLKLMRLIDEYHLQHPSSGSRTIANHLKRLGYKTNRKRACRLMRKMGIEAIYPKPRTSSRHPGHKVYPYLLRNMKITRPNQVWASDITYIPMDRGFMYLVAVMDWHSRKILSWRVSNTLDKEFCIEAAAEAIEKFGPPEIFNTDQGAQFTSVEFTNLLKEKGISISMDGRGRARDNIFIERFWWSLKYQYVYLRSFENGSELRKGLSYWICFYNQERPHQSLQSQTPDEYYFKERDISEAA